MGFNFHKVGLFSDSPYTLLGKKIKTSKQFWDHWKLIITLKASEFQQNLPWSDTVLSCLLRIMYQS
jgi:hypothetical protein